MLVEFDVPTIRPHTSVPGDLRAQSVKILVFLPSPIVTYCDLSILLHYFEVNSINSSKMIGDFPKVVNFNQLFSNSIGSFVTSIVLSPYSLSHTLYIIE